MIGAVIRKLWLPIVVIVLLGSLVWAVNHYRDNAITYKDQRGKATDKLSQANDTIDDMKVRQRDVAALDAKYTQELVDAKETIERLHSDVIAGRKRLQLNARLRKPARLTPPELPAWMMQPAPDLLTPLNGIISPSDSESKPQPSN